MEQKNDSSMPSLQKLNNLYFKIGGLSKGKRDLSPKSLFLYPQSGMGAILPFFLMP